MKSKTTLLICVDWFWPGYLAGGPVRSVIALIEALHQEIDFKVITQNADIDNKPYAGITPNCWVTSPLGCLVYYISKEELSPKRLQALLTETTYDVVYLNSFFSYYFSILPLRILQRLPHSKKVILAPRGMLGKGALALKPFKKKLFLVYAKLSGIYKGVQWHATSEQEVAEIKAVMGATISICNIANLTVFKKVDLKLKPKSKGALHLCFVSRISPKKNLKYTLQVLSTVSEAAIQFSIFGPIEDTSYWHDCEKIMKMLPNNITVSYKGSYQPEQIVTVFESVHVLMLPTLNENFGHVIVESLLNGVPVIISDQTPWRRLSEAKAGFDLALSAPQHFKTALLFYAQLTELEMHQHAQWAQNYVVEHLSEATTVLKYQHLFCKDESYDTNQSIGI